VNRLIDGIIFDIDGTRRGLPFAFFTNDNSNTIAFWVDKFAAMGIEAAPDEVVTSALVAAEVMAELHGDSPILAVGDVGLLEALRARELDLVDPEEPERAKAVVMGKDPNFDQHRLNVVCQAIWNGAEFFATNYDPRVPTAEGFVPATGPMVKAVAYATGQEPIVTGKPSPWSGRMAMRILGVAPERGLVVGDQLATDIAMGRSAGMSTCLVLTGTAEAHHVEDAPAEHQPHVVVADIGHLIPWLDEQDLDEQDAAPPASPGGGSGGM
jgi:4-nitrophenyl phosphatase